MMTKTSPLLFLSLCAWPVAAMAHTGVPLRAADGSAVADGLSTTDTVEANGVAGAMEAGPPMSPKASCSMCHDYDTITSGYHFQLGLDEMVDADGDGFKDEYGQVVTAEGAPLASLPTLRNLRSPGQLGGW